VSRASNGDLRLWIGSIALHLLFVVMIAIAAMRWRAEPPLPQLAIEGSVVRYEDLPALTKAGKPLREPATEPMPAPAPDPAPAKVEPAVEPAPKPPPKAAEAAEAAKKERAREAALAESQRAESKRAAAAQAKAEQQQRAEAARKREAAAAETQQQAKAEQAARAAAERDRKLQAAREAKLRAALAAEEEGEAIAQSGVIDEYRALLVQTIQRNWIRPATARAGLECTLYVTQATGGTVLDVKLGDCNGDAAVRESVTNAVYRSSPLPAPRDARAFERRLVIVFKPTE
jgi:colicin import membrane protein